MQSVDHAPATPWSLDLVRALEWKRFQEVCAVVFEHAGYCVEIVGQGEDGGIDLILTIPGGPEGEGSRVAVRCSAQGQRVGVILARQLQEMRIAFGCSQAIFVTTAAFTGEAEKYGAENRDLLLLDGPRFLEGILGMPQATQRELLALATEGDYTTPSCPRCGVKMERRRDKLGVNAGSEYWACGNLESANCLRTFPITKADPLAVR